MTYTSFGAGAAAQSTLQKDRPKSKTVDIIVDNIAYYHPYPSNSKASKVWKYFRCKRSVEYSEQGHCVYCMECCSQQIDGDTTKTKKFECTDQSRDRVIGLLKEHVANHGTVCAAHNKWTLCALCALLMINLLVSRPSEGKNGHSNPSIQTAACFGEEGRPFSILAWMGHAWFSVSAFTTSGSISSSCSSNRSYL